MSTTATELTAPVADTSGVAAALDAAADGAEILDHTGPGHLLIVTTRPGHVTAELDLEHYLTAPARPRGTVKALTAEGFVDAFQRRTDVPGDDNPAAVYADIDRIQLVAVLNDDVIDDAGWRDHRITYQPQYTPEWLHWTTHQGLGPQAAFAQALEDGETEIRDPSATVMLELAETFHASTSAKFKQAGRRRDGRVQLVYEEEIEATAGEGMVEIPDSFTIAVRPFFGAHFVEVVCRLRYRVTRGDLEIGYTIHRPEEIVRTSFVTDVVANVRDALAGHPVIEAVPADPTGR